MILFKSTDTRISDTLDYLQRHQLDPNGWTSRAVIGREKQLSERISLSGWRGLRRKQWETQQRLALQGLLLTYLVWTRMPPAKSIVRGVERCFEHAPEKMIRSQIAWVLRHRKTRETQARRVAAELAIDAIHHFAQRSSNGVSFEDWDFIADSAGPCLNCYGAVLYWLFRSGAFSHRWLLPISRHGASQGDMDELVTGGRKPQSLPQLNDQTVGGVEAGRVILAYRPDNPLAHVVIADGGNPPGFISNNTPLANCDLSLKNNLVAAITPFERRGSQDLGVFAGINGQNLKTFRPVRLTWRQLQGLCPLGSKYTGYAILKPAPWDRKEVWER